MSTPGVGQMLIGGVICAIGLGVTVVTAAGASGGGRYVVAWGAILVGGIQFVRGLINYLNHEPEAEHTQAAPVPAPSLSAQPPRPSAAPQQTAATAPIGTLYDSKQPSSALVGALAGVVHDPKAPSQNEFRAIQNALIEAGQSAPSKKDLAAIVATRKQEQLDLLRWLKGLAPSLDPQTRTQILRGCFAVMLSDIPRSYAMHVAGKIGEALAMSPEQVKEHLRGLTTPLDGKAIQITLGLTPAEAESGKRAEFAYWALVTCVPCGGNGCEVCSETGRVRVERRLAITTPPGVKDGEQLRCDGEGDSPLPGGQPGDLYIRVKLEPAAESGA